MDTLEFTFTDGTSMYRRFVHDGPRSNRNLFERFRYLDPAEMQREDHFVCHTSNGKVLADLAIQQSPYREDLVWLKHVEVDRRYRKQGIATELIRRCFEHVEAEGKTLEFSSLSEDGKASLPQVVRRLRYDYPELTVTKSHMDEKEDFGPSPEVVRSTYTPKR
jgi:GNAT superfamily N-acetyltransferase